ncbi:hypothetical protein D5S18_17935 [Nocardia panacis]|uniref:Glycoside hydrolase family 5 domain-containing protein n=1 Tax=Nocardia panacis TaxID=2340916 RepID=A0A3A4K855_9NOCA|nr:hypothetical protein D5S18_17935 [Nocardia panacis]
MRGITYGLAAPPERIMPAVRGLGAGVLRCFLYWSQIEPEPGRFVWDAVDALLDQLDGDEEVWITVSSASLWGTVRATDMLPPSPAKDLDVFAAFVRALVDRCRGRITYWQFDNEPCVPILWAGTVAEYAAQLKVFAAAVRESDPAALVVLGGDPPDQQARPGTFEYLVDVARDDFDVYDIHLYGDPYTIPDRIAAARAMMAQHGYEMPIVAGEYNGPLIAPEDMALLGNALQPFGEMMTGSDPEWSVLTTDMGTQAPEHDAMLAFYERMPELPPRVQMYMRGCPPEYEELRHRENSREIVVRNLLALASGVRRTLCWNLAPEFPGHQAPYTVLGLMFDKFALLDYADGELTHRYPAADALALTARMLQGAEAIERILVADRPELYVFDVRREDGSLLVAWARSAEEAATYRHPWLGAAAHAVDAHGAAVPVEVADGAVTLPLTPTPLFVTR